MYVGVEIGFERSAYFVNEDAGTVTVCAAVIPSLAYIGRSSWSVIFRTAPRSAFIRKSFSLL